MVVCGVVRLAAGKTPGPEAIQVERLPDAGPYARRDIARAKVMLGLGMRLVQGAIQRIFIFPSRDGKRAIASRSTNNADKAWLLEEVADNPGKARM